MQLTDYSRVLRLAGPDLQMRTNFDLTVKSTMKMKCLAAVYVTAETPFGLKKIVTECHNNGIPFYLIGLGANTLFATSYFDGVVINLGQGFKKLEHTDPYIISAGAAVTIQPLLNFVERCGLMGLEFMTKIPGTVGGSLAGNAGAGGIGLCDRLERVYLMTRCGFIACINAGDFWFDYRHSDLREAIILSADFRLEPLDTKKSAALKADFESKKLNQPYHIPSCGCIFKNPTGPDGKPVSAGKIIDDLGLKGYNIRSAHISEGHANFIVNKGNSCGEDFLALISMVRDIVYQRTNINLELEVNIVGGPLNSVVLN